MLIKSACNVHQIYKEYHTKSLQNVDISSVKEQEKQTRMKKQKYKITTECPQKVYKNRTTNVCKMSMNKVHPMSSQCMYLFKTICQNANIFFVEKS